MIRFILIGKTPYPSALYSLISPTAEEDLCQCISYEKDTSPALLENALSNALQECLEAADGVLLFVDDSTTLLFPAILSTSSHYGNVSIVSGVNFPMLKSILLLAEASQDAASLAAQAVKLGQDSICHIDHPSEDLLQGF